MYMEKKQWEDQVVGNSDVGWSLLPSGVCVVEFAAIHGLSVEMTVLVSKIEEIKTSISRYLNITKCRTNPNILKTSCKLYTASINYEIHVLISCQI